MTHSRRQHARATGVLYLVTHVTSVLAVVAYGAGTLTLGVALEFALAIGCAGTGVLLWMLLHELAPARAAAFALLRGVEASVIIAGALPMLALHWGGGAAGLSAEVATDLHTAAFLLGQGLVISVNTIVLGWALWGARILPRPLAGLGLAGGGIVLVSNLAQLGGLIPLNGTLAGLGAIPVFAFELWLAIHLIVRGVRTPERTPVLPAA